MKFSLNFIICLFLNIIRSLNFKMVHWKKYIYSREPVQLLQIVFHHEDAEFYNNINIKQKNSCSIKTRYFLFELLSSFSTKDEITDQRHSISINSENYTNFNIFFLNLLLKQEYFWFSRYVFINFSADFITSHSVIFGRQQRQSPFHSVGFVLFWKMEYSQSLMIIGKCNNIPNLYRYLIKDKVYTCHKKWNIRVSPSSPFYIFL